MSPCKSSRKINFTNFCTFTCTFTQWIFFNHAMNVFFPDFNVFLRVVENSACLFNEGLFTITTKTTLVIAFFAIFFTKCVDWQCRQFVICLGSITLLTYSFCLIEVKKSCLSVSDKFSKSCFKMSKYFVTPDIMKSL